MTWVCSLSYRRGRWAMWFVCKSRNECYIAQNLILKNQMSCCGSVKWSNVCQHESLWPVLINQWCWFSTISSEKKVRTNMWEIKLWGLFLRGWQLPKTDQTAFILIYYIIRGTIFTWRTWNHINTSTYLTFVGYIIIHFRRLYYVANLTKNGSII